jgi:protein-S-isoprenylcysteine O-methyltransferase Ste14
MVRPRMIWRLLPFVGSVLFVVIVFGWRPWLQRRRHGTWGITLLRSQHRSQNVRDAFALVLFVLLVGQGLVAAAWPDRLGGFRPSDGAMAGLQHVTGAIVLFGGIALLVAAVLDLGGSWRIGIEEDTRPGLVTDGLYRICRNPIFAAILLIVAGYAVLLPTRLSLLLLLGTYIGIRQQVSAEEAYLLRTYGESYRRYARQIGRFLPGLGKLR